MEAIKIREEQTGDAEAIRRVNTEAFGQPQEAQLVDALRNNCSDLLSLVAVDGQDIVGHILFSPALLGDVEGMGLAPMAVIPARQRDGVGSELVRAGLAKLEERGCLFVIVLGHADYYPRFGFERASARGSAVRVGRARRSVHAPRARRVHHERCVRSRSISS